MWWPRDLLLHISKEAERHNEQILITIYLKKRPVGCGEDEISTPKNGKCHELDSKLGHWNRVIGC